MKHKIINGERVPYEKPEDELIEQAEGGAHGCWVAIYALGFINSPKVADFLAEQLSSKDWARRRAAVEAVRFQNPNTRLSDRLIALLKDPYPAVQRVACESLREMKLVKAIPSICDLLNNEDSETRKAALKALDVLWSDVNWTGIFSMATADRNLEVRKTASRVLRQHVDVSNWHDLFKLWCEDSLAEHRTWACEILGDFGGAKDRELLEPLCTDENGHVRKAAATALNKLTLRQ